MRTALLVVVTLTGEAGIEFVVWVLVAADAIVSATILRNSGCFPFGTFFPPAAPNAILIKAIYYL
jgi:hypothetical protein